MPLPSEKTLSALAESVWLFLQTLDQHSVSEPVFTPISFPVVVALSGGVDSTVLLHTLVELRDAGFVRSLSAVHVHHGLSTNADFWAEHCRTQCQQWSVPCVIERVSVGAGDGDGIEQAARTLRYQVFEQHLPEGGCLLQGHHQDDQAETLLFRLFRGSGLDGLAGIPQQRPLGDGVLFRPLLSVSRRTIEAYATKWGLDHIEDESNLDQRFSRNYLRQNLIPEIEQRWPGVSGRLAVLANDIQENNQWMHQQVADAAKRVLKSAPDYWNAGQVIDLQALEALSGGMAMRVVRFWLSQKGLMMPDRSALNTIFTEVIHSREDAEPSLQLGEYEVRRFDGLLVLVPALKAFTIKPVEWNVKTDTSFYMQGSGWLSLTDTSSTGSFLASAPQKREQIDVDRYSVYFRHNLPASGKVRVSGRRGSKTIKRWLQEYRVPPWLRDRIPFLFSGNFMLGAAGLWQCDLLAVESEKPLDNHDVKVDIEWRFDP